MSFYFDDDDHVYPSQQADTKVKSEDNDDDFACDNCGGTTSYMDETTGGLTCTECFTQSQNIVAASQMEMDIEDALGLAGRNRGGQLMGRAGNRGGGGKRGRPGKTFAEYDTSVKLPDTLECIEGIQRILRESTKIICDIAGSSKQDFPNVLDTVKAMWQAYLVSWKEGAEYYSPRYPEIRFSFRDQFLSGFQRSNVSKTLSYKAAKKLKEQITKEENDKFDEDHHSNSDDNSNHQDVVVREMEDDESHCSDLTAEVVPTASKADFKRSAITQMIQRHLKRNGSATTSSVGRKEAALMLEPSMLMVACILLIATASLGVTTNHIRRWIANGSLPLLNAFALLKPNDQTLLKPITQFFRLASVPSVNSFERMLMNLHVACGYKPRPILLRKTNKRKVLADASKSFKPGRTILPSHVPIIAARFVADLGLKQQVLNYTLSIMGQPISNEKLTPNETELSKSARFWLPPPLRKARPDFLLDTTRILAVIVVACKMIPGWEEMTFHVPAAASGEKRKPGNESKASKSHFVPSTPAHFRFLKNGPIMDNYLDFVETNLLVNKGDVIMPGFIKALEQKTNHSDQQQQQAPHSATLTTVLPNDIFLACKSDKDLVSEGGTDDESQHPYQYQLAEKVPNDSTLGSRQLSPPLGPLLEYMAYKTAANPIDILDFVAELDEEIAHKCKKHNGRI